VTTLEVELLLPVLHCEGTRKSRFLWKVPVKLGLQATRPETAASILWQLQQSGLQATRGASRYLC
jgi:hypothetical protein